MNIFDWMVRTAEKNPDSIPADLVNKARIFVFDELAKTVNGLSIKDKPGDNVDVVMPFDTLAVVDRQQGMIIQERGENKWRFLDLIDLKSPKDVANVIAADIDVQDIGIQANIFSFFAASVAGKIIKDYLSVPKEEMTADEQNALNEMIESTSHNALTYIKAIDFFVNRREYFILEEKPLKKYKAKKGQIRRQHQRPLYTVLSPYKIREKMGIKQPVGDRKSPRPHERRRHEKFLSDDKYRYDIRGMHIAPKVIPYGPRKGQLYYKKIMVPAVWVGPKQSTRGNKVYRVRTDL